MKAAAPERSWDWAQIAVVLIWKLAPKGFVMLREDMARLPMDRVLLEDRRVDRIVLSFITLAEAKKRGAAERGQHRATVSELQGRWQKIAVVALWSLSKTGVTLSEYDRAAVPDGLQLMASGHEFGVEWRFLPRWEAKKHRDWDLENEGKMILENLPS
jgi:hypothetical protein